MVAVELYYSIAELSILYRFSDSTIRKWVKEGRFSPPGETGEPDLSNILEIGDDLRVPATGCKHFESNHRFSYNLGVKARNKAELRRKIQKGAGPSV